MADPLHTLLVALVLLLLGGSAATFLFFRLLDRWERRKPVEERDEWGPWGFVLIGGITGLAAAIWGLAANLLFRLQGGFRPEDPLLLGGQAALATVASLAIYWSVRGRQERIARGYGKSAAAEEP